MENIVIKVVPELRDYFLVLRSYTTRGRVSSISLGVLAACTMILLLMSVGDLISGVFDGGLMLFLVAVIFGTLSAYPLWIGRLSLMNAKKREHLLLPTSYDFGEEKILIANQIAEAKYSWGVFAQPFENEQYYLLNYATNRNMIQFIPKRSFISLEQEKVFRAMLNRHLGEIENIQSGLRGWKLSLLVAVSVVVILVVALVVLIWSISGTYIPA